MVYFEYIYLSFTARKVYDTNKLYYFYLLGQIITILYSLFSEFIQVNSKITWIVYFE